MAKPKRTEQQKQERAAEIRILLESPTLTKSRHKDLMSQLRKNTGISNRQNKSIVCTGCGAPRDTQVYAKCRECRRIISNAKTKKKWANITEPQRVIERAKQRKWYRDTHVITRSLIGERKQKSIKPKADPRIKPAKTVIAKMPKEFRPIPTYVQPKEKFLEIQESLPQPTQKQLEEARAVRISNPWQPHARFLSWSDFDSRLEEIRNR